MGDLDAPGVPDRIDEIKIGKIQSARVYVDSGAIMAQLGVTERLGLSL